jgi:hypothetical protein
MAAGWLAERLASFGAQPAIRTGSETVSYKALADAVAGWLDLRVGAPAGEVVLLSGDASPGFLALLLALLQRGDIAVPMAPVEAVRIETCAAIVPSPTHPALRSRWELERNAGTRIGASSPLRKATCGAPCRAGGFYLRLHRRTQGQPAPGRSFS